MYVYPALHGEQGLLTRCAKHMGSSVKPNGSSVDGVSLTLGTYLNFVVLCIKHGHHFLKLDFFSVDCFQNIDGLHARACSEDVVELHGSLWKTRCLHCEDVQENREMPICVALDGKVRICAFSNWAHLSPHLTSQQSDPSSLGQSLKPHSIITLLLPRLTIENNVICHSEFFSHHH